MDLLPDELLRLIFDFVPNECKIKLNTKYYTKYHHLIIPMIINRQTERYIRSMVWKDCDFVMKHLIDENYDRWLRMTDYYYVKCDLYYENYIYFLLEYCEEHNSPDCKKIIMQKIYK